MKSTVTKLDEICYRCTTVSGEALRVRREKFGPRRHQPPSSARQWHHGAQSWCSRWWCWNSGKRTRTADMSVTAEHTAYEGLLRWTKVD